MVRLRRRTHCGVAACRKVKGGFPDVPGPLLAQNRRGIDQVSETEEIGFDRNAEALDAEVFNCRVCRSGRVDYHV